MLKWHCSMRGYYRATRGFVEAYVNREDHVSGGPRGWHWSLNAIDPLSSYDQHELVMAKGWAQTKTGAMKEVQREYDRRVKRLHENGVVV